MVTVVGMWEPGYSLEQMFLEDTVWKQTLSAFAVDGFVMVTSDTVVDRVSAPTQEPTMAEALAPTTGERVFMLYTHEGLEGVVSLSGFVHPRDAVYVFGRPGDNLHAYVQPGDHCVHVDTPNEVDMLACSCVAAVLYDRQVKL